MKESSLKIRSQKKQLEKDLKKQLFILNQFKQNAQIKENLYLSIGWLYDQLALKDSKKRYLFQAKAIQFFKKAIKSKDKEVKFQGLRGLATVLLHQKKFKNALNFYNKAYLLKKNFHIYNDLGNIYQKMGQHPKALKFYKMALNAIKNKKDKEILAIPLFNLIKLSEKMNKKSEAKNYTHLLKKISKNSSFAKELFEKINNSF